MQRVMIAVELISGPSVMFLDGTRAGIHMCTI